MAGEALGGDHGDAVEAAGGAREAGDGAARVVAEVRSGGARADAAQVGVATEDVRAAARIALARGEYGPTRVADRVEEGEVLAPAGGLGELDVVDDLARTGAVQPADHAAVQRAAERPPLLEVAEGLGVDPDDEQPPDRLGAANVESGLQRLALERRESAGLAGGQGDGEGGKRHRAERR